ncbi:MAG: BON domain-containing protein [Bdellovibrionaceae bacterium]|nr:BON domain-containing protein [Pseudobdellovibrionaceae bacterium]
MKKENNNDQNLKKILMDRLNWDFRVSKSDVKLFVKNGIVAIYGYFDKNFRRAAAIETIASTQGVLATIDNTQVLGDYHRSDTELETILEKRLLDQKLTHGEWVKLNVQDGVVTWEGSVCQSRFKAWISKITWELSGVKDCYNFVRIVSSRPNESQIQISDMLHEAVIQ